MREHHEVRSAEDVDLMNDDPPSYRNGAPSKESWWHPRRWSPRLRLAAVIGAVLLLVVVVVAAIIASRANRYPRYKKLNYSLQDTCEFTGDLYYPQTYSAKSLVL